jgi:CrcB protein
MKHLLLVAMGGAVGAMARYKLGGVILHHTTHWKFPLSTFAVNVSGCLAAGLLAGLVVKHDFFSPEVRLLLFTGLLGGYTTFSAFGLETVYLLQRSELYLAIVNVGGSALAGILVLWFGMKVIP